MNINRNLNPIVAKLQESRAVYCHALEVNDVHELESIVDGLIESLPDYEKKVYIDFFETVALYAMDESQDDDVYNFDFAEYINSLLG